MADDLCSEAVIDIPYDPQRMMRREGRSHYPITRLMLLCANQSSADRHTKVNTFVHYVDTFLAIRVSDFLGNGRWGEACTTKTSIPLRASLRDPRARRHIGSRRYSS